MTNWTELKRLAEEASWTGRWYDAGCNTVMCTYVDKDVSDHDEIAHPCPLGITGFIAAANPKTILSLIAENERLSDMANRLADEGISIADERDQLRAEVEALRELLRDSCEAIRHGEFSTGICCCGSSVDSHGFGDGHSPVDEGDYYASGLIERIDSALKPNQ